MSVVSFFGFAERASPRVYNRCSKLVRAFCSEPETFTQLRFSAKTRFPRCQKSHYSLKFKDQDLWQLGKHLARNNVKLLDPEQKVHVLQHLAGQGQLDVTFQLF